MPYPLLTVVLIAAVQGAVQAHPLDQKCKAVAAKEVKELEGRGIDYTLITWDGFYASKIDACVATEVNDVGNRFLVRETSSSFFKGDFKGFFQCDDNGASVADLDAVRVFGGRVDNVPYRKWNHDGYGGLPSTNKMPDKPYTKARCKELFYKMIKQIR